MKINMSDSLLLIRSQILYLLPFFIGVVVYFVLVKEGQDEWWTTVLKCAPILFLMLYIYLKGFDCSKCYHSSQRILLGLGCSCVGDALLNNDLFPQGMAAFGLAQIFYISAFGWKPLKLEIGIPMYLMGAIAVSIFFHKLRGILVFGLPLYTALLLTMCWRAVARSTCNRTILNIFCAVGSILFVISDGLIAVNRFLIEIPHAGILIMSTYYMAQFAIALSTAPECKAPRLTPKHLKSTQDRAQGASPHLQEIPNTD